MSKLAWGRKRTCKSCGVIFYDMKKDPAACPDCGSKDTYQPLLKPRRITTPSVRVVKAPKVVEEEEDDEIDLKDDEDNLISDASDLGNEEEDVSEVKEHIDSGNTDDE